jgi:cell pole-organizing protein PopZ
MAETANTNTPPMDEILASIRRIITDEPLVGSQASEPGRDESDSDEDVLELGEPPAAAPVVAATSQVASAPSPQPGILLSQQTQAASQRALAALSGLSIDPNADANTMDGLVREMLRPMLKEWLDTHLPEMVERLVAREVARISGR